MSNRSTPVLHPQLHSQTFESELSDSDSNEAVNQNRQTNAPIAPINEPQTVRVGRPVPAIDFVLQRPIVTTKDLMDLVYRPAALNTRVTCRVFRFQEGIDKLHPRYQLCIEHLGTDVLHPVLTARRERKSQTCYYTITGTVNDGPEGETPQTVVLGKVRSNFLGTTYAIYSHGRNPMKKENSPAKKALPIREELGAVLFDPNILGFKGPRRITVLMHTLTRDGKRPEFRPTTESETLLAKYRDGGARDLLVLHNKIPQWNEESQSFVLNFNGRVTQPSVKNFQIVHDNDLDYLVMQFGRVERDNFTLDFKYPLCLLQAFGIALTSFDVKLACE